MGQGGVTGAAAGPLLTRLLSLVLWVGLLAGHAVAEVVPKAVTDRLSALSGATLNDLAGGKTDAVYARFDAGMRRDVSADRFAAQMKQNVAQSGAIRKPRTHAITVYRQREILVAVDWSGMTTSGGAACGFLLWSGAETDDPKIRRFEVNYLSAGLAKGIGARQAAALMVQFRCGPALIKQITGMTVNLK